MYKYASSMVRALNSEGIYVRNRNDMIRVEYGLFKGLQKLASKLPEEMSPKDAEALEKAQKGAKERAKKFAEKTQKKMEAYAKKKLGRFTNYGLKIEYEGLLHKGDISFTLTNNYLNRRGEKLDAKGFKAFTAEVHKQKKDYAKYMTEAMEEVDRLINLSSLVYEGKGEVPKEVTSLTKKVVTNVLALLGIGTALYEGIACVGLLIGGGILEMSILGVLGGLVGIVGAGLLALLINKVRQYGFKDAFKYFKLKSRDVEEGVKESLKVASARPSVDYQVGLMMAYRY